MSKKVAVIFERTWGAYNSGERAGFEGHVAESLVKGGARRHDVIDQQDATTFDRGCRGWRQGEGPCDVALPHRA